jgi:hypothetical protein
MNVTKRRHPLPRRRVANHFRAMRREEIDLSGRTALKSGPQPWRGQRLLSYRQAESGAAAAGRFHRISGDDYGMMRRIRGRANFMPAGVPPVSLAFGSTRRAPPPDAAGLVLRGGEDTGAASEGWITRTLATAEIASAATTIRPVKALLGALRGRRTEHPKCEQTAVDTGDSLVTWISACNGPDRL